MASGVPLAGPEWARAHAAERELEPLEQAGRRTAERKPNSYQALAARWQKLSTGLVTTAT